MGTSRWEMGSSVRHIVGRSTGLIASPQYKPHLTRPDNNKSDDAGPRSVILADFACKQKESFSTNSLPNCPFPWLLFQSESENFTIFAIAP